MTAYREELLDRVIRIYGFEHPTTIAFAEACEASPKSAFDDLVLSTYVDMYERLEREAEEEEVE